MPGLVREASHDRERHARHAAGCRHAEAFHIFSVGFRKKPPPRRHVGVGGRCRTRREQQPLPCWFSITRLRSIPTAQQHIPNSGLLASRIARPLWPSHLRGRHESGTSPGPHAVTRHPAKRDGIPHTKICLHSARDTHQEHPLRSLLSQEGSRSGRCCDRTKPTQFHTIVAGGRSCERLDQLASLELRGNQDQRSHISVMQMGYHVAGEPLTSPSLTAGPRTTTPQERPVNKTAVESWLAACAAATLSPVRHGPPTVAHRGKNPRYPGFVVFSI
jgi:hypothetical protein